MEMDENELYERIYQLRDRRYELEDRIDKAIEYNKQIIEDVKEFYRPTKDIIYSGDSLIDIATQNIEILKGEDK